MENEFDLDKFNADWESSQSEVDTEIEDVIVDEDVEPDILDDEQLDTELDEEVEEEEPNPNAEDDTKRNAAFAQLRRERDEAKRLADWIATVAEQNGTTPEEMMKNYENATLQKQAEEKGVPVDLLQRMKTLEEENAAIKNTTFAERFNADVERTVATYGASESEVDKTFQYMQEKGLMEGVKSGIISFEELHKLAHLDTITEKKVNQALQQNLSSKKKRQQEAPLPNGSSAAEIGNSLEDKARADAKRLIENGDF